MIEKERQARENEREKREQEAMMNEEQGRSEVQAQGINEKYYKRMESFTGEQAWRDWSFQSKSATKTANEATYHLIETAEKKEKEIDDALSLSEEERSLSSPGSSILEPFQMLHTSGFSGFEAWRKLSKKYEREAEKQQETNMKEMKIRFGRWQRLRNNLSTRSQLLSMGTGC